MEKNPDGLITLFQASKTVGLAYSTLAWYARKGRFQTWQTGKSSIRKTTLEELWRAIAQGKIGARKH